MTETHEPAEDDVAGCALSDADLAILAAPATRYAAYVRSVREEYAHLDEDAFALGRAQVLEHLAEKPTLFHTEPARAAWESAARANLASELGDLRRQLAVAQAVPPVRGLRTRSPPATRRRTSSRLLTGSAPAATTSAYHSDGTS